MVRGFCIALVFLASTTSGGADELFFRKNSVTVFGGVYTTVNMHQSFSPIADHDSTYLIAAAYRREFVKLPWNVVIGGEAGVGFRFGSGSFGEIWAAPTIRWLAFRSGPSRRCHLGSVLASVRLQTLPASNGNANRSTPAIPRYCSTSRLNSRSLLQTSRTWNLFCDCITVPACTARWGECVKALTRKPWASAGSSKVRSSRACSCRLVSTSSGLSSLRRQPSPAFALLVDALRHRQRN